MAASLTRALLLGGTLVVPASCRRSEARVPAPADLVALAAAWSGGRTDPTCQPRGPRGEYLGGRPGAEYCQWPTVVRGRQSGTVSGTQNEISGLRMIMWERAVPDSATAARLRDSLSATLTAQGLAEYPCPAGGRRWLRDDFAVEFLPGRRRADGRLHLGVVATTIPGALVPALCPAAPQEPAPVPGGSARAASAGDAPAGDAAARDAVRSARAPRA
jgi:hypothetical protein